MWREMSSPFIAELPDGEVGLPGLDEKCLLIGSFSPLGNYGRSLALHWNPPQVGRRGIGTTRLRAAAALLAGG